MARWELQETKLHAGLLFDFDTAREKAGLMRKEEVAAAYAEAVTERIRRHRANPVTDPVRQFDYDNPTGRTLHPVASGQDWKDN